MHYSEAEKEGAREIDLSYVRWENGNYKSKAECSPGRLGRGQEIRDQETDYLKSLHNNLNYLKSLGTLRSSCFPAGSHYYKANSITQT